MEIQDLDIPSDNVNQSFFFKAGEIGLQYQFAGQRQEIKVSLPSYSIFDHNLGLVDRGLKSPFY